MDTHGLTARWSFDKTYGCFAFESSSIIWNFSAIWWRSSSSTKCTSQGGSFMVESQRLTIRQFTSNIKFGECEIYTPIPLMWQHVSWSHDVIHRLASLSKLTEGGFVTLDVMGAWAFATCRAKGVSGSGILFWWWDHFVHWIDISINFRYPLQSP